MRNERLITPRCLPRVVAQFLEIFTPDLRSVPCCVALSIAVSPTSTSLIITVRPMDRPRSISVASWRLISSPTGTNSLLVPRLATICGQALMGRVGLASTSSPPATSLLNGWGWTTSTSFILTGSIRKLRSRRQWELSTGSCDQVVPCMQVFPHTIPRRQNVLPPLRVTLAPRYSSTSRVTTCLIDGLRMVSSIPVSRRGWASSVSLRWLRESSPTNT